MNKLTSIRIKQEDGTYSEEYPVSVLAENVVWEQGQSNSLVDILGQVSFNTNGSIQHQIDVLDNKKFNTSDLNTYLASQISTDVTSWLNTNVNPIGSAVTVDESLSISGSAADAKKTGDEIADVKSALVYLEDSYTSNSDTVQKVLPFKRGWLSGGDYISNSKTFATEQYISTGSIDTCQLIDSSLLGYIKYYNNSYAIQKTDTITAGVGEYSIDKTYPYFRASLGYLSGSDVLPESALSSYVFKSAVTGNILLKAISEEITNARTGADGAVYPTLGDAIREPDADFKQSIMCLENSYTGHLDILQKSLPFKRGWINGSGDFIQNSKSWATEEYISTDIADSCVLTDATLIGYVTYYNASHVKQKTDTITATIGEYAINKAYPLFRTNVGYLSSSDVAPKTALESYVFKKQVTKESNVSTYANAFNIWVLGGIIAETGKPTYASQVTYITPSFIPKSWKSVTPNTGYYLALFAYSNGGYVGTYNGSSFAPTFITRTNTIDIDALRVANPTYDYKLLIGKLGSGNEGIRENIKVIYNGILSESSLMDDEVQRASDQARFMRGNSGTPLTLLHFSDIHGNADRLKDIVDFSHAHSAYINDVICTGDMVGSQYTDGMGFWNGVNGAEDILTCIGNHDAVTSATDSIILDMATLCAAYITPYISNWGTVSHDADTTYYYKDYANASVRLIVLDCMHEDATQISWLESALSTARTNNLHVIIGFHYPSYPRNVVACAFSPAKDLGNYDTASISASIVNAVDAFQQNGGVFIGYLTGHEHSDAILTVDNHPNQLVINITCATNVNAQFRNSDQYRYGDFANAFNLTTINTKEKTISIKRIGADMDMFLRDRKTFCYDYGAHRLLN